MVLFDRFTTSSQHNPSTSTPFGAKNVWEKVLIATKNFIQQIMLMKKCFSLGKNMLLRCLAKSVYTESCNEVIEIPPEKKPRFVNF
jgi:hypothetical protein